MISTALKEFDLESTIVRNPLIVSLSTPVTEAITQMSNIQNSCSYAGEASTEATRFNTVCYSCVLVVEETQLVGILTERDVVRLSSSQTCLENLTIADVMTHPVITLCQSQITDLFAVLTLFQQHHIRHLPILDDQAQIVGLLTHDSLRLLLNPIDLLRFRTVAEVMTAEVVCAAPTVSVRSIAQLMTDRRVSCVVIVETTPLQAQNCSSKSCHMPVGIITERDIIRFHALQLNFDQLRAQDVMTAPASAIHPTDSLWSVQLIMQQQQVQRLLVSGQQGELLGIVTQTSLLKVLNPLELYKFVDLLEQKVSQLEAEKLELLQTRNAELEQQVQERTAQLAAQAERERLVSTIVAQIWSSTNLQDVLNIAVTQVRSYLQCDRVSIWQFQPDWQPVLAAEATVSGQAFQVGKQFHKPGCIPNWVEPYKTGHVRVVCDSHVTEMSDCHRKLLEQLNIQAKILVPILQGNTLWGLLSATESQPREWISTETDLLQQLATQLGIAIQRATADQQAQIELAERKRTESILRQSEATNRAIVQAIPDLLIRMRWDGQYLDVTSGQAVKVIHPQGEIEDNTVQDILSPDLAAQRLHYTHQALKTRTLQVYEQTIQIEGTTHYEEVRIVPNGEDEVLVIIRDITDRKHTEIALQALNHKLEAIVEQRTAELRQSNDQLASTNAELARATRLKDEFMANMSHELRTPLTSILGFSTLLNQQLVGELNTKQVFYTQQIHHSGQHLLNLINDILDLSKIESGKLELRIAPVSVKELCEGSLLFIRQQASQKQIQLSSHIPDNIGNIVVDELRMRQVLINLLSNAVKFTPEAGKVHLEAVLNVDYDRPEVVSSTTVMQSSLPSILFHITDTGMGIATEHIGDLFKPFIQIDSSLNRQQEGTGLGLALVKQIVELHGGRVSVSTRLGEGSRFTVELPYHVGDRGTITSPTLNSAIERLSETTTQVAPDAPLVLLVEDNDSNVDLISDYLSFQGYRMVLARHGHEALSVAREQKPDLILMDIQMPGMDGLEATQHIRADRELAHIPIIALTALAMQGDRERCLAAGANEYLTKPVQLRQLTNSMKQLLSE